MYNLGLLLHFGLLLRLETRTQHILIKKINEEGNAVYSSYTSLLSCNGKHYSGHNKVLVLHKPTLW